MMPHPDESPDNGSPQPETVFRVDEPSIDATTAWDLRPALLRVLYASGPKVWVDLSRVEFIDSTGLGMLIGVLKEARGMEGDLRLTHVGREVRRILKITGLEALFTLNTDGGDGSDGPDDCAGSMR